MTSPVSVDVHFPDGRVESVKRSLIETTLGKYVIKFNKMILPVVYSRGRRVATVEEGM